MRSINKVILLGRVRFLSATELEPEKADGYLRFNLETTDRTGDGGEVVNVLPCIVRGRLAEILEQFVKSGREIYLEGKLRPYRESLAVTVDTIQLLGQQERRFLTEEAERSSF